MAKGSVTHHRNTLTNDEENVEICLNCPKPECVGEYCELVNPDLVVRQRTRMKVKYKKKGDVDG
uniref:Uncharacterized protein n=1 Tax=viral metagenome TaxID=1070528 RepID=A0A6M3JBM8_9ZZZZ